MVSQARADVFLDQTRTFDRNHAGVLVKKLTDAESVELAIPIIQEIWDSFVERIAMLEQDSYSPPVSFTCNWYKYDLVQMRRIVERSMTYIYGKYCGTFTLDATTTFSKVSDFMVMLNGNMQSRFVYVESKLFEFSAAWIPGRELCFNGWDVSLLADDIPGDGAQIKLINNEGLDKQFVSDAIKQLSNMGTVISVEFVPQIKSVITVVARPENVDSFDVLFPQWIVMVVN